MSFHALIFEAQYRVVTVRAPGTMGIEGGGREGYVSQSRNHWILP